jgi:long-chain acyl-CoA synthetase
VNKPWLKSYPAGVPADIDLDSYTSLVDIFERSCSAYGEQIAYANYGNTITYADLDRLSSKFAAWLQNRGMRSGDRIALMMPNVLQYPIALFGALRAGGGGEFCPRSRRSA